jgi:PKD repeat protein
MRVNTGRHIARPSATVLLLAGLALAFLAVALTAGLASAAPNLYVESAGIEPEVDQPTRGTTCVVEVDIGNDGDANATGFYVKLQDVTASTVVGTMGPYNLTTSTALTVKFNWDLTGASGGKHTLRATVDSTGAVSESDEEDNTATKDVTVNLPPTASASASQSFAYTNLDITFSASGSSDSDGNLVKYLWYFGDGKVGEGANVTHSYADGSPSPGKYYNITLVVTDEDGGAGSTTISIRIYNRLPFAVANDAWTPTATPLSVSGSASYDQDGKVSRYRWTLHNGTVVWGNPLVVSYPDDGRYLITLTVWDDDGESDTTTLYITALNQAPKVNMVANKTLVTTGESIRFNASLSYDVDGVITTFTWIFGDTATGTGAVVDHEYSQNGSYNVTVVAVDDDGALNHKTVRVIVGNTAPIAVAQASNGYVLTLEDVEFTASSSSDPDNNIATYNWDFGDGRSAMGQILNHSYSDDGTYIVTLTVTDTGGIFGIATITIVVGNRVPVVGFADVTVTTGETAHLNGSYCYDLDGYIASYMWDLGAGLVYTTANATHVWHSAGVYNVKLKIWDDDGDSNETTFNVTVLNRSPLAVMTASPVKTTLAMPVHFNGTGSYDPDGTITNWTWRFGDGTWDYGNEVDHTYSVYGTYLATLTVQDDSGGFNTTGILITVRNQPPTAVINVTFTTVYTGETITFDGSNSTDPENQIANFYWSFGDGESDTGPTVTHSYDDDGLYNVRLTVIDEDSTSSFMELMVKVLNRDPIAKAEAGPSDVKTLEDLTFTGESSKDEDGTILWYHWDFDDGSMGYGMTVVHAYRDDGHYSVTLTVTDDDGGEATHTISVLVGNRAPFAVAGDDQTTQTGIPVRLDGRGSFDMDGYIAQYHWDFGDETSTDGSVVTHSFPMYGTFVVELTVTDDDGMTAKGNLTVTVSNVEPVARMSGPTRVLSGESVELDGTSSYDLDGTIDELTWDWGDGSTFGEGLIDDHIYDNVGTYIVTLTVKDDGDLTSSISMVIEVLNRRPIASATASTNLLLTGGTVKMDGTASSDPDGTVRTYTWIFGDGSVAYGSSVNHVYSDNGIYMVVLTVTDDLGGTDSTSMFIQVENRPPLPAIESPEESLTLLAVDLTAEGSLDPDGDISGYFWDFGDGSGQSGWNVTHVYATGGTYTIRMTVMDDDGRTATTNVTIDIINRPPVAMGEAPKFSMENSTVKFEAIGSHDPDGILSTWEWDFGDDRTGEGHQAYHRYINSGTYLWVLTVTDDAGASTQFNGSIDITEAPEDPGDIPDKPDKQDDDQGLLPGPSALLAMATLALVTAVMVAKRKRRD